MAVFSRMSVCGNQAEACENATGAEGEPSAPVELSINEIQLISATYDGNQALPKEAIPTRTGGVGAANNLCVGAANNLCVGAANDVGGVSKSGKRENNRERKNEQYLLHVNISIIYGCGWR